MPTLEDDLNAAADSPSIAAAVAAAIAKGEDKPAEQQPEEPDSEDALPD